MPTKAIIHRKTGQPSHQKILSEQKEIMQKIDFQTVQATIFEQLCQKRRFIKKLFIMLKHIINN